MFQLTNTRTHTYKDGQCLVEFSVDAEYVMIPNMPQICLGKGFMIKNLINWSGLRHSST